MTDTGDSRVGDFKQALLSLNKGEAEAILKDASGRPLPFTETETILVPALEKIGRDWEDGAAALSQVYMAGRLCEMLMNRLYPTAENEGISTAKIAIVVLEDYHLLGMRLVSSVLRASGLHVTSYGRMDLDALIERVKLDRIDILLVSVLMLRSALRVKELRERLAEEGLTVKLAVGGAPFRLDKGLWKEVGADGTSNTAAGSVSLVKRLILEAGK